MVVVLLLGLVVVVCLVVVVFIGPAAVPVGLPAAVLFCEPIVAALFVVVLGPALVLLPPIADPVDPAVCAPAQAKAVSKTGAVNHIRFMSSNSPLWIRNSGISARVIRVEYLASNGWIRLPKPSDARNRVLLRLVADHQCNPGLLLR